MRSLVIARRGFLAQNTFAAQETFNGPEHADWWLCDPVSGAPLDCNTTCGFCQNATLPAGHGACFGWTQGFPGKLYDWRIPAVRSYWTNEVIAPYGERLHPICLFSSGAGELVS